MIVVFRGEDMAWGTSYSYDSWLSKLAAVGGNFIRVWMASWGFAIEWQETGLGNYTARLGDAWLLDHVFGVCEQKGIVIQLCLNDFVRISPVCYPS